MRCTEHTNKGTRCMIEAEPGKDVCHVHDPDGLFRKQHPLNTRKPKRRKAPTTDGPVQPTLDIL